MTALVRRYIGLALVAVLGAASGLWVAVESYAGLLPLGESPSLTDRLPWLTHPVAGPTSFAAASVVLALLVERLIAPLRHRR